MEKSYSSCSPCVQVLFCLMRLEFNSFKPDCILFMGHRQNGVAPDGRPICGFYVCYEEFRRKKD